MTADLMTQSIDHALSVIEKSHTDRVTFERAYNEPGANGKLCQRWKPIHCDPVTTLSDIPSELAQDSSRKETADGYVLLDGRYRLAIARMIDGVTMNDRAVVNGIPYAIVGVQTQAERMMLFSLKQQDLK